jgi:diguanylate cyclase (GGDEF)-like protein/PAS domain S-box-containing protein
MTSKRPLLASAVDPAEDLASLRTRLAEAEAVIEAIRGGRVDALMVAGEQGAQVLTLKRAEHDYRLLVEEMGEGAMTVTARGQIYFANRRLATMLGTARETLIGTELVAHLCTDDRPGYLAWLERRPPRPQQRMELRLLDARGSEVPCHLSFTELSLAEKQGAFCVVATDLSAQKQAEEALRLSEQRLKTIVENLPIGVWLLDATGQVTYGNTAADRLWADAEARLTQPRQGASGSGSGSRSGSGPGRDSGGSPSSDPIVVPAAPDRAPTLLPGAQGSAARAIRNGETRLNEEIDIHCVDGAHKIILNSAVPIRDQDGRIAGAVVLNQDITERKTAEERIEQLAFYDALTGLPNRRLLLDRLQQVQAAVRRNACHGALLFIDLDHFKDLNDSLGHDVGDQLLQQVARRLLDCVRASDTVARLGGDEFVVILEDLSPERATAAAQARQVGIKVLEKLSAPYQLGSQVQRSTPSIGATLISASDSSMDDLLKHADLAMYRSKEAGRNQLRFFDPQMQTALDQRTRLEAQLYDAFQHDEFRLYYQPQVDQFGRVLGAEALVRWVHPERGLMSPDGFIPIAEASGQILRLGTWVLESACARLGAWSREAGESAAHSLAINISARQFLDPAFVEQVRSALQRHQVDPQRLTLELTESLLLQNVDETITKMTALRKLGLRFALDDFGTGYSSLAYLKRLPLDELKIDRSFVADVIRDTNDAAIVRAILALAPKLGLSVIAEGVETREQHRFLVANGCRTFQGYLFGAPGPAEDEGPG